MAARVCYSVILPFSGTELWADTRLLVIIKSLEFSQPKAVFSFLLLVVGGAVSLDEELVVK